MPPLAHAPHRAGRRVPRAVRLLALAVLAAMAGWVLLLVVANGRVAAIAPAAATPADQQANDSARVLDELDRRFGFDAETEGADASPSWSEVEGPLRSWMDAQLFGEDDAVAAPPEAVSAWLGDHDVVLEAVTIHLLEDEAPRWQWRLGDPRTWMEPAGARPLQDVLLASALERAADGNDEAALALLDCSWRANEDARAQPSRMAQLLADLTLRRQAGLLRKLRGVPASWDERLAGAGPRAGMRSALEAEASWELRFARGRDREAADAWLDPPVSWPQPWDRLADPWRTLAYADVAERVRRQAAEPADGCVADEKALESAAARAAPWWNPLARQALPGAAWVQAIAARTQLELEWTREVLAARRTLASGGRPDEESPCASCPGRQWTLAPAEDGGFTLALSGAAPGTLRVTCAKELRHLARPPVAGAAGGK